MADIYETALSFRLHAKATIALFIAVLLAFVAETQITQYLQTTLQYRQSYFIFYVVHSCFSFSFPIHLLYVLSTTKHELRPLLKGLRFAIMRQLSPGSRAISATKLALLVIGITGFYSAPSLLWFTASPLTSVTDITALWNANAFFAYIFSVKLLDMKWGSFRAFAVCLASLGVVTIVYGGTTASSVQSVTGKREEIMDAAPFVGDMLALVASIVYGLYQVLYTKYVALPSDPELIPEFAHYSQVSTSAGPLADEEISTQDLTAGSVTYPPPFGLYPNLITASIGLCTSLVFWIPIPLLHYYGIEVFRLPSNASTVTAIAGIAASGLIFNAGFMTLLGIWGPIVTSAGNLLTIVLILISDLIFGTVALSFGGLVGAVMIMGAFGILVYDMCQSSTP
ncbi:hypothetical protein F5I97DRAFT_1538444 [Phlebopus sp. FC_14]|nr:hypothetical protein F5I97DRAFT_1538444 [Phlebopus sp. FC_14]